MYPLSKKWRSHFFEKKPLGVRVRVICSHYERQ